MARLKKILGKAFHGIIGKHPNNTIFSYNWAYVRANRKWFSEYGNHIRGRTLDFGCGYCPYFPFVRERVSEYHGYDFNLKARQGLPVDAKLRLGDLKEDGTLPEAAESYDTVISNQVMYSVRDVEAYFREARRVLKPGGRLFLTDAFIQPLMTDPYDYQRTTPNGFQVLFEKHGFTLVHYVPSGFFFSGSALTLNMLLVLDRSFSLTSTARLVLWRQVVFAPLTFVLNAVGMLLDSLLPFPRFPANMLFIASKNPGTEADGGERP